MLHWTRRSISVFCPQHWGRNSWTNPSRSKRIGWGSGQELGSSPGLQSAERPWAQRHGSCPHGTRWLCRTAPLQALSSRNVLGSGQNPTDFGKGWKRPSSLESPCCLSQCQCDTAAPDVWVMFRATRPTFPSLTCVLSSLYPLPSRPTKTLPLQPAENRLFSFQPK